MCHVAHLNRSVDPRILTTFHQVHAIYRWAVKVTKRCSWENTDLKVFFPAFDLRENQWNRVGITASSVVIHLVDLRCTSCCDGRHRSMDYRTRDCSAALWFLWRVCYKTNRCNYFHTLYKSSPVNAGKSCHRCVLWRGFSTRELLTAK
jgi:hypothetical protein